MKATETALIASGRHPEEIREVAGGEGDGQCGDGPRVDDEEERPAEEEREERPVRFAEEDVHAAGLGHGRAELGESEGAEEAEEPPTTQTESMRSGDGRTEAMDLGTRKIPEPMTPPMTMEMTSQSPRTRGRFTRLT